VAAFRVRGTGALRANNSLERTRSAAVALLRRPGILPRRSAHDPLGGVTHMAVFKRIGFLASVALLLVIAAVGFFGQRFFGPLAILGLPFSIPGFLVLGVDEVQERCGYWGEPLYFWLLSLSCAVLFAWLLQRTRGVRHHADAA